MTANSPLRPGAADEFRASVTQAKRARLVRDSGGAAAAQPAIVQRFALRAGDMYRISYAVGGPQQRRVSRSIAVFGGESERRSWGGDVVSCLDFSLPHGRTLSLLADQLVDARAAELNERGQWVLADDDAPSSGTRRRRGGRRVITFNQNPHPI